MFGAVKVKDKLYEIINENRDSLPATLEVIEYIVLPVFNFTGGLWEDLSYGYKAAEILTYCETVLRRLDTEDEHRLLANQLVALANNYRTAYQRKRQYEA